MNAYCACFWVDIADQRQRRRPRVASKVRKSNAGMTLIEVLVALAIFSLLAAVLLLSYRIAERSYQTVMRLNQGSWRVVATQRLLRRVLSSAYPVESTPDATSNGIDGTARTLSATGPMPIATSEMGFYRYRFVLQRRSDGYFNFVVQTAIDSGGRRHSPRPKPGPVLHQSVLLARIAGAHWSYLAAENSHAYSSSQESWVNSWHDSNLPLLIRLHISFPPGDARIWPLFIVHPRITNDAQCQFNAIAQICIPVLR